MNEPTPRITRVAYSTSAVPAPSVRHTAREAPSRRPRAKARALTGPGEAARANPRSATEKSSLNIPIFIGEFYHPPEQRPRIPERAAPILR